MKLKNIKIKSRQKSQTELKCHNDDISDIKQTIPQPRNDIVQVRVQQRIKCYYKCKQQIQDNKLKVYQK